MREPTEAPAGLQVGEDAALGAVVLRPGQVPARLAAVLHLQHIVMVMVSRQSLKQKFADPGKGTSREGPFL